MMRKRFVMGLFIVVLTGIVAGSASAMMMGTAMPISPATSDLVWDDVTKMMGVGTNTPMYNLDVTATNVPRSSMHLSLSGTDTGGVDDIVG